MALFFNSKADPICPRTRYGKADYLVEGNVFKPDQGGNQQCQYGVRKINCGYFA